MKTVAVLIVLVGLASASPVTKVLQLLGDLEVKLTKDSDAEQKAYDAYAELCKDGATNKGFEIKTATSEIEDLKATIDKATADIGASATQTDELASAIAANEADLKAATGIRLKEESEFVANEAELVDTIGTLDRAINILERKMKGSALLEAKVNNKDMANLVHVLSTVLDATSLSLHDKKNLVALAQSSDDSSDEEEGAPAADAYVAKSGNIVDVLEDLREKAENQLNEARKEEVSTKHNYEMLRQSLEDEIKEDTKQMGNAKAAGAAASETKAVAEGNLGSTEKTLADAEESLAALNTGCQTAAADHDASVKNRAEELAALAAAKKAIAENTAGADSAVYSAASFIQVEQRAALATRADLANLEVVQLLRQLARRQGSAALAQLATRVASVVSYASHAGEDPFAKVKQLLSDMVEKLTNEGAAESTHKEWCDEQMGDTSEKTDDLKHTIDVLSVKIDKATSQSATLKGQVQGLQSDLAEIAKSNAEMDEVRKGEHAAFVQTKADLEQGLKGVRMALKVLREYYSGASLVQQQEAHDKASGAGSSIIGMIEVCESDFGKSLAEAEMDEDTSSAEYQKQSMLNKLSKATYEKDAEYKKKEATSLDKAIVEYSSDRSSAQTELDAVLEYSKTVRGACELKPETYGERKGRRDAELAGLKDALNILNGEALLQKKASLRGVVQHLQ